MDKYYSYLHCTPNGYPFYVGSGKNNRCYDFSGRHVNHKSITEKYGKQNISVFVFPCESKDQARLDEKQQIIQLRKEGYSLVNIHPAPIYEKIPNISQYDYNAKLAEQARKRRAMYYRLHINKGLTATALAKQYGVTHQCMSKMLRRAKEDLE